MKTKILLFLSLVLVLFSFRNSVTGLDFDFAESYCSKIEKQVRVIAKQYDLKSSELIPIIYPECSRFSVLSNVFESDILSYYYVQNGRKGADFSVGYFQMKPSFLEDLEEIITKDSNFTQYRSKFAYANKNTKEIRTERLNRLFSETWQIEYLCVFVKYTKLKYKPSEDISLLEFSASAYNYGFTKPHEEIIFWTKQKAFPNGLKSNKENFVYSELAQNYKLKKYGNE
ncbi:MAG: hypothetical protein ACK5B9_04200 [Flavobacteriia bacterium]